MGLRRLWTISLDRLDHSRRCLSGRGRLAMESMKKKIAPAALGIVALASPAKSGDEAARLTHLLQPKFQVAEVLEAAGLAAEKCPGFHLIEHNITAEYHSAGASDNDMYTPEFKFMSERGKANAAEGYAKNPAGWCEIMWKFLGPAHPSMIKHTLLTRDTR